MAAVPGAKKCADELARAAIALLDREPFFAHLLAGLTRVVGSGVTATAAVGLSRGRPVLHVAPEFFVGRLASREQRVAVLKHEVLHLVLGHLFRDDAKRSDPLLRNVAADLVVNQLVGPRWPLPDGAIQLSTFPTLALAPDRTLEHYYDRLLTLPRETLAKTEGASDHGPWGTESGPADRLAAQIAVDRLLGHAADRVGQASWGSLPGAIRDALALLLARRHPELDWRRVVRSFAASSRRSRVRHTLKRPSRRYGSFPGLRIRRLSHLLVAVDTSGSISDAMLEAFFTEVHGAWRAGADVTVVECDAAVQRSYPYRGTAPTEVTGRGGTAFDPVFEWMRESGQPWDGCIYLTDAVGPVPRLRPPCPLLWVVTGPADAKQLGIGRVTHLST